MTQTETLPLPPVIPLGKLAYSNEVHSKRVSFIGQAVELDIDREGNKPNGRPYRLSIKLNNRGIPKHEFPGGDGIWFRMIQFSGFSSNDLERLYEQLKSNPNCLILAAWVKVSEKKNKRYYGLS